jgi:hypothetical protein
MRKLIVSAIIIGSLVISGNPVNASQPDNFGQCQRYAASLGVPHAEIRPPFTGGGPAVIFYDAAGNVISVNTPPAFFYGLACNFPA